MLKLMVLLFFIGLNACGMQGDLYLPEEDVKPSTEKPGEGSLVL